MEAERRVISAAVEMRRLRREILLSDDNAETDVLVKRYNDLEEQMFANAAMCEGGSV